MSIKDFRQGKDEPTDLETLHNMLIDANIKHIYKEHQIKIKEPQVIDIIGYYPAGTHQIIVDPEGERISIIRGAVSFGDFELYSLGTGKKRFDADRFETEKDVIKALI